MSSGTILLSALRVNIHNRSDLSRVMLHAYNQTISDTILVPNPDYISSWKDCSKIIRVAYIFLAK